MNNLPSTKADAREVGAKHYFTGIPCARGHIAKRYTSTGQCTDCQRDNRTKWRTSNPDKERDSRIRSLRAWALRNPEKKKEHARLYNKKASAKNVARAYRWKEANKERHAELQNASDRRRRARERGGGSHTANDVTAILVRQKYKCAECGARVRDRDSRHVDHINPLAKGGTNDRRNLQILCVDCNLHKAAKDPIDYARSKGRLV